MAYKTRARLVAAAAVLYVLYVLAVFFLPYHFLLTLLAIIAPLILYESLVHIVLRALYGRKYRYFLFNYFLVPHSEYGYCFRRNTDSNTLDFPVFDRFVFRGGEKAARGVAENKKRRAHFTINSLGFRGPSFSQSKKEGIVRIFASGGSTTAGDYVDDDDTWPAALEKELQKEGYRVEIVNAGVQGWTSWQEFLRFQNEIVRYEPDIVLLHQGWNEEHSFSSQNLGKWWKPRQVRNVIETLYFFSPPLGLLSRTKSLFVFLALQAYFKNFVFDKKMPFSNPEHWKCLKERSYMDAWFDNVLAFAREAKKRGIGIYFIQYPGLPSFSDTADERREYAKERKASPLGAHYYALLHRRIGAFIAAAKAFVPRIETEKIFSHYRGKHRLPLFYDEVHMTPQGNALLAQAVARHLLADSYFLGLFGKKTGAPRKSNVGIDEAAVRNTREKACACGSDVAGAVDAQISALAAVKKDLNAGSEVPADRYTTF